MEGWVKLHRIIAEWEWWDDLNTFRLFATCLIYANHKDKKYRGKVIPRGSFLTGWEDLAAKSGLSVRSTRTSFNKLKSTGELTRKATSKGSLVTVVKYSDFQERQEKATSKTTHKATNDRQASDKLPTTTKNEKNEKNEKKRGFIRPTLQEVDEYGLTLNPPFKDAARFIDYYDSNGWKVARNPMKDWKATVRNWNRKRQSSPQGGKTPHQVENQKQLKGMGMPENLNLDDL